jgi:hypothetical protein
VVRVPEAKAVADLVGHRLLAGAEPVVVKDESALRGRR